MTSIDGNQNEYKAQSRKTDALSGTFEYYYTSKEILDETSSLENVFNPR